MNKNILKLFCNTKRINAKWKLTIINFNNLKNEYFAES